MCFCSLVGYDDNDFTSILLATDVGGRLTTSCTGISDRSCATWLIMPTLLPEDRCNDRNMPTARWSGSPLRVPKPSSMNRISDENEVPASARASARDKETMKLSPPDEVMTGRLKYPLYASSSRMRYWPSTPHSLYLSVNLTRYLLARSSLPR